MEKDNNEIRQRYSLRQRNKLRNEENYYDSDDEIRPKKNIFSCNLCKQKFTNLNNWESHKETKLKFSCTSCSKNFCTLEMFTEHVSSCFKFKQKIFCKHCGELFSKEEELHQHLELSHFETKPSRHDLVCYKCDICYKRYKAFKLLSKHIASHIENHYCNKCKIIFRSSHVLESHKCNKVSSPTPEIKNLLECHFCGKLFKDLKEIKRHILYIHLNNKLKCKKCNTTFAYMVEYENHLTFKKCMSTNKKKRKLKYECNDCSQQFTNLKKLKYHINHKHNGIMYECNICKLKFETKLIYEKHLKMQTCKIPEPCPCDICGKIFIKEDYLKKHQYSHKNETYKCKYCFCLFIKESSFIRHMNKSNCCNNARKQRLRDFNYKLCRECNVEYSTEDELIQHFFLSHSNLKPHQCFCCSDTFSNYQELTDHINFINLQKFTCTLCNKSYTSQEGLRKHRLKHKGSHFKCKFCDSTFLKGTRYQFHLRTCKNNPDNHFLFKNLNPKPKLLKEPKQRRQLNWESDIIVKRLRIDPNSVDFYNDPNTDGLTCRNNTNSLLNSDSDSSVNGEGGWFDKYYQDFDLPLTSSNNISNEKENEYCESLPEDNVGGGTEDEEYVEEENVVDEQVSQSDVSTSSESSCHDDFDNNLTDNVLIEFNPKKCRLCYTDFTHEYELLHHFIKTHNGLCAHKCPKCEHECNLFAQMKEHWKIHGVGVDIFHCNNCSKTFKNEKKLKKHNYKCKGSDTDNVTNDNVGVANGKREDYCKKCFKSFRTKCGYRRHKQICKGKPVKHREKKVNKIEKKRVIEQPEVEVENNISDCGEDDGPNIEQVTEEIKPITIERQIDLVKQEPPLDSFPCRLCHEKFQYERGLVVHFKKQHPGQKALVCGICGIHLADKLKEHLKTHGIGEEFICELCGKKFNQKFLSKIHELWHQGIEYKCETCKQKFLTKEKMEKHLNENKCKDRLSVLKLPCEICGKSYKSRFVLTQHYFTHAPKDLKPMKNRVSCETCGKWFQGKNGLVRHRRIHTGERPYCCRYCPKAFAQEGNCKAHERIHTGEVVRRKKTEKVIKPYIVSSSNDYKKIFSKTDL